MDKYTSPLNEGCVENDGHNRGCAPITEDNTEGACKNYQRNVCMY